MCKLPNLRSADHICLFGSIIPVWNCYVEYNIYLVLIEIAYYKKQASQKAFNGRFVFINKGLKFINISNMWSFTTCHKISSKGHSNELDIKALLPQVFLVYFLLTKLFWGLLKGNCFDNITNNVSELLAIFEIYRNTIKKTYV